MAPERRRVVFRNGAEPQMNACHANAVQWASETADVAPVLGWLIESGSDDRLQFVAHSVVRDASGLLIDITPMEPVGLRFIPHEGTAEAFFGRLPHCNQITWPIPTLPIAGFEGDPAPWSARD